MYNSEKSDNIKHFFEDSATEKQIQEHTEKVRKGLVKCHLPRCWNCKTEPEAFSRHEARQRQFYVIIDDLVRMVLGLLIRWKCPGCGKTFTDYPDFAVPYKRYTVPTIKKYCGLYTEDHETSYRTIIINNAIGHLDSERQLNHSTIHRWITSFGSYNKIVRTAQDLYLQAKPESSICRELALLSIPSKKYRTEKRKGILQKCRQLLKIEIKFHSFFSVSIFPYLATQCGFS